MPDQPLGIVLIGATATGKTELAMALSDALGESAFAPASGPPSGASRKNAPVALISMDSTLVYRGMDIGTAKPTASELARYPHALVDICDPAQAYSAADFVRDADAAVTAAVAADQIPVLVGGTMLYAKAFQEGLADMPSADPETRASIKAQAETAGWPALHARLQSIDPEAALKIHPHNTQRLQRALEVYAVSGKPMSWWWAQPGAGGSLARTGVRFLTFALEHQDRKLLHTQIEQRFARMLEQGFISEVQALRARGDLSLELPSMRAVGYRQAWEHLAGAYDHQEMVQRATAATRQLAKRQLTWLRSWPEYVALVPGQKDANTAQICAALHSA